MIGDVYDLAVKLAEDREYVARRDAWRAGWRADGLGFKRDPRREQEIEDEFVAWVASCREEAA